jgi:hypothetical protein
MVEVFRKWWLAIVMGVGILLMSPVLYKLMSRFDISIGLNNQSGLEVTQIRMSEPGGELGPNLLLNPIPTGRIVRVPHRGNTCIRNIQVTYANSETQDFTNVDACTTSTDLILAERIGLGVDPNRRNPSFNILNQSNRTIIAIHVSPVTASSWGTNRLVEGRTLEPGTSVPIFLPSGECHYDARVTFAGGATSERRNVNTCRISFMAFQ